MSDLIERLRAKRIQNPLQHEYGQPVTIPEPICAEAAETILALRKEVEAMKGEGAAMWRCGVSDTIILVDRVRRLFDRDRSLKRNRALANMDAELEIVLQDWFSHSRSARPNNYNDADAVFKGFSAKSHLPAALAAEAE